MKYVFELILATIIIFFVWNTLKRMFFKSFYRFPGPPNPQQSQQNQKKKSEQNLKWDAETVDYEEIKEDKK